MSSHVYPYMPRIAWGSLILSARLSRHPPVASQILNLKREDDCISIAIGGSTMSPRPGRAYYGEVMVRWNGKLANAAAQGFALLPQRPSLVKVASRIFPKISSFEFMLPDWKKRKSRRNCAARRTNYQLVLLSQIQIVGGDTRLT